MITYRYNTQSVCSKQIFFDYDRETNKVSNIKFVGGCEGNLKAISKLCNNKDANEIINLLEGNTCGYKDTSCADQLVKALKEAKS